MPRSYRLRVISVLLCSSLHSMSPTAIQLHEVLTNLLSETNTVISTYLTPKAHPYYKIHLDQISSTRPRMLSILASQDAQVKHT